MLFWSCIQNQWWTRKSINASSVTDVIYKSTVLTFFLWKPVCVKIKYFRHKHLFSFSFNLYRYLKLSTEINSCFWLFITRLISNHWLYLIPKIAISIRIIFFCFGFYPSVLLCSVLNYPQTHWQNVNICETCLTCILLGVILNGIVRKLFTYRI